MQMVDISHLLVFWEETIPKERLIQHHAREALSPLWHLQCGQLKVPHLLTLTVQYLLLECIFNCEKNLQKLCEITLSFQVSMYLDFVLPFLVFFIDFNFIFLCSSALCLDSRLLTVIFCWDCFNLPRYHIAVIWRFFHNSNGIPLIFKIIRSQNFKKVALFLLKKENKTETKMHATVIF